MKRILCVLFACALCFSGFSALAVEDGEAPAGAVDQGGAVFVTPSPVVLPQPLQVELTVIDGNAALGDVPAPETSPAPVDDDTAQAMMEVLERVDANTQGDSSPSGSSGVSFSTLDSEQPDREGLAGLVSGIFGSYTPRTYTTITYTDGGVVTETEIVPGVAGLDWPWLCGAALFGVMLFSLFKLLGGLWK